MLLKTATGGGFHYLSRGGTGPGYYWPGGAFGTGIGTRQHEPLGLTAFACAVRLVAESLGSMVMRVYEGDGTNRQVLYDDDRAGLLQDGAEEYATSFDVWSDVATEVELDGWGLIWKSSGLLTGKVRELYAFPLQSAQIFVDEDGRRRVQARIDGELEDITSDVIVVRGWSPIAAVKGVSTPELHHRTLRGSELLVQYRGRYFESDSMPQYVISKPGSWGTDGRKEFRETWNGIAKGPAGDPMGLLWGGMTVQTLTKDMQQSQVAALQNLDDLQVAQMMRIFPQSLIVAGDQRVLPPAEVIADLLWRLTLMHRCRRVERAVSADRQIFPKVKTGARPFARFDASDFLRGDIATMAAMIHSLVQAGVMKPNEGRSAVDLPPSDDPRAEELQATPVGGAENPDPNPDGEADG